MKNVLYLCLVMLATFAVVKISDVHAQTASGIILLSPSATLAGCAWPTGATVTNGAALCPLNLSGQPGLAMALNGGAFTQMLPVAGTSGVASFNGRTGNVTLTAADVTGSGVKATTTVTSSAVTALQ